MTLQNIFDSKSYSWLITGVGGFIGSNILEILLENNQKVVGLDNFLTGYKSNIESVLNSIDSSLKKNFTFIEGDIRSLEDCKKALKGIDFVLHQAALGSVPRSIANPLDTNDVNVSGFLNIIHSSKEAGVKKFVYASSSSVYGDSDILPKREQYIGNPLSPYAVSKRTNELYAHAFSKCYGMPTIGLRYFNVFGYRQDPKSRYAAVIPLWIGSLLNGKDVYINGDGENTRDFCYIDNVVQANILAALTKNNDANNKIYNVAYGETTSLNQLFDLLKDILNIKNAQPIYRDFREGDVRESLADISDAKKYFGYFPNFSIKEGLQVYCRLLLSQSRSSVTQDATPHLTKCV